MRNLTTDEFHRYINQHGIPPAPARITPGGRVTWDGIELLQTPDWLDGGDIPKTKKNHRLLQDMKMDVTDLLMRLFKKQPRIIQAGYFSFSPHSEGSRHYERDDSAFRGTYAVFFRGDTIAIVTCKPHKTVRLVKIRSKSSRTYFAQQLLLRSVHDMFPEATIIGGKK